MQPSQPSHIRELYQTTILEHNKSPRNFGMLSSPTHKAHGDNPLCGDKITLTTIISGERNIQDVAYTLSGCAISKAAASLMTERIKGESTQRFDELFDLFRKLVTGKLNQADTRLLKKLIVFSGISQYPARVKCAILPWYTFRAAIEGGGEEAPTTTTENDEEF